uniref:ribosomal protein S4 n=1 Tax=Ochrosphaera neapolitana TaxID=35137 RepID=UPI00286B955F|nr:ribosomal protein S4 [Ochrosphaera neapolitana]WKK50096.1 ribosomal protein S4 [Ochrosphaera neapolitana]
MARYTGAKLRIIRRLGDLPGLTSKIKKRTSRPGQHGAVNKKPTQYAIRLEEKQKLRFNYGISEKQLMNYVKQSKRIKGASGTVLLNLLEMRLDNLIFRLGLAPTIAGARQLVSHKHIYVNQHCVSIPSYQCQPGDSLSVKKSLKSEKLVQANLESPALSNIPQHLDFDKNKLVAKVLSVVDREWVALKLNELLVIEYYSRKL